MAERKLRVARRKEEAAKVKSAVAMIAEDGAVKQYNALRRGTGKNHVMKTQRKFFGAQSAMKAALIREMMQKYSCGRETAKMGISAH